MQDTIQLQLQIKDLNIELKKIIHSFSIPQSAPQSFDLRSIDAKIFSVFAQSSKFLKPINCIKKNDLETIDAIRFQLEECKTQSTKFIDEINKKETEFTKEIDKIKSLFKNEISNILKEQSSLKNSEIERHKKEMEALQSKIDILNSSYNKCLSESVGKCCEERDDFKKEYNLLKSQLIETKNHLEKELLESENKVEQLSNDIKKMEAQNSEFLLRLETTLKKNLTETELNFKAEISRLLKDTDILKSQIQQLDSIHNDDLQKLRKQLELLNSKSDEETSQIIRFKKKENEEKEKNLIEMFSKEESDYEKTISQKKSDNQLFIESIKEKLSNLKEQVSAQDAINTEKLKATNLKADQEISEKDAKLKKLIADQKNVIEITKKRFFNELKKAQKKNETNVSLLHQKLVQQQTEFDNQKKQLEQEVIMLIKKRNIIQMEVSSIKNGKQSNSIASFDFVSNSIADIVPYSDRKKVNRIGEMTHFIQEIDKKSQEKLSEVKNFKLEKENEANTEKQKLIAQFEKEKTHFDKINEEVRLLKIQKDDLLNKQKVNEDKKENELIKMEQELREKISIQREVIRELHDDIQKVRVDDSNKKILSEIQIQHCSNVKQIQDKIDDFDQSFLIKVQEKYKQMDERFMMERQKSINGINKMIERITEALKNLCQLNSNFVDESNKELERWNKLRNEINNENIKIYSKSQNQDNMKRPFSSASSCKLTQVKSPLPRLKK